MSNNKNCVFCEESQLEVVKENDLAFAVRDKYPVKPMHTLIIPRRHVCDVFDTTELEREAMHSFAHIHLIPRRKGDLPPPAAQQQQ